MRLLRACAGGGAGIRLRQHKKLLQEEKAAVGDVPHTGEEEIAIGDHDLLGGGVQHCREAKIQLVVVLGARQRQ
jgi:hypothetical protein